MVCKVLPSPWVMLAVYFWKMIRLRSILIGNNSRLHGRNLSVWVFEKPDHQIIQILSTNHMRIVDKYQSLTVGHVVMNQINV